MHYRQQQQTPKHGQLTVLQKLTQQQLLQKVYHILDASRTAVMLLHCVQGPICNDIAYRFAARVHDTPVADIGSKYLVKYYAHHASHGQDYQDTNHADRVAALQQETLAMQQAFAEQQSALHSCKQLMQQQTRYCHTTTSYTVTGCFCVFYQCTYCACCVIFCSV